MKSTRRFSEMGPWERFFTALVGIPLLVLVYVALVAFRVLAKIRIH